MSKPAASGDYRRILTYVIPYWRGLAFVLALSLVSTALGLAQPYITKLLIDGALLRRSFRALVVVAGLMVVATIAGFLLNILSSYRYVSVSANVLFDMRLAVYRHLQCLSPRFFARSRLGDIVSRLNNDIGEAQRVAADTILASLGNLIFLAGSIAIMLALSWKLFLVSIALLPVSVLALKRYRTKLATEARRVREHSSAIGSFLIETLMGMRLVVSSNAQEREVDRFRNENQAFIDALLSMQLVSYLASALPGTVLTLSTALVFLYGGKLVIDGALSLGGLVAFMAYHMRLLSPIQNLMSLYTAVATARVSLSRVFEILDAPVEVADTPHSQPVSYIRGDVEFDRVSLKHDRDTVVLDSVSFRVPAGSVCAIAGPSGVGKSTIADLLLRFYDPAAGVVKLDGRDLREIRLADLRRLIALVEQSPILFNTTIAENIRYGCPSAGQDDIVRAARAAAIEDFILSLPDGFDTQVGEAGQTLSAGERQRIAIARALLRDPAVIVLDEPTASLDPANEQNIALALSQVMRGRTTIVISHRMSLIQTADIVVVMDAGRVVETGRPADLMSSHGALSLLFRVSEGGRVANAP